MFKNLIFDIDGTLLNTKEVGMRALQKALYDDFLIEQTLAELEFAFSGTALQVYEKYHIPLDRQDAFAQHVLENSEIMAPSIDPFPGIEDLLQQLQQQAINLAIVTSENHFELEAIFGKKTIAHYFQHFVTADDVRQPKPDPEPTVQALQILGARPSETLFIGDSRSDIASAHQAQVAFGLAGWGANPQDNFDDADYQFAHPQEVLSIL